MNKYSDRAPYVGGFVELTKSKRGIVAIFSLAFLLAGIFVPELSEHRELFIKIMAILAVVLKAGYTAEDVANALRQSPGTLLDTIEEEYDAP